MRTSAQRIAGAAVLPLLLSGLGCERQLYGAGMLYLYNGTKKAVEVRVDGRTQLRTTLDGKAGKLHEEVIAGPHSFTAGTGKPVTGEIVKEQLTVFNVSAVGCFARADVSGMYKRGKAPVKVLKLYWDEELIQVPERIDVLPGDLLPFSAPTTPYAFQRFLVVPCRMAKQKDMAEETVAEFVRRVK